MINELSVIGLVRKNSKDYIHEVFNAFKNNQIVVPIKSKNEIPQNSNLRFENIIEPSSNWGWVNYKQEIIKNDSIAQISFTSGTTGEPKGIILTHTNLSDVIERVNAMMCVDETIREYIGVPVYHSFGFGRVRACLGVGGAVYIPEKGFNLLEILRLLEANEINAISVVPTLCRIILNETKVFKGLAEKVRWIEIGSQYMSRYEKEQMKELFPAAQIVQHYGLTEASRTTFLDITRTEGDALESVGQPTGNVDVAITSDGLIKVRGNHVASSRISSDGGRVPLTDSEGWLVTNDQGIINNGYLFFQGRADDVINCGGLKIIPDLIEREIGKLVGCNNGFAVTKVRDRLRGDGILVAVKLSLSHMLEEIREKTKLILENQNVQAGNALHFEVVDSLPVTETGKIKRKALTEEFNKKYQELELLDSQTSDKNNKFDSVINIFQSILDIDDVRSSDSFISLGGDSLAFIAASIAIEDYIGWLPENWEGMTFADLEQLKAGETTINDKNRYKQKTIHFILFLLVFLIGGECFLQMRSQLKHGRSAFNLVKKESAIVYNEEIGVKTYRPNLIKNTGKTYMEINSLGLRSPEIPSYLEKNELRIAVVGSSTVVFASSNDETFSHILENKLSQVYHSKVNVICGGIEGLTLTDISKITKGLVFPLKPSIIIIYTGLNNISKICRTQQETKQRIVKKLGTISFPNWALTREMIRKNTTFLTAQQTPNTNVVDVNSIDLSNYGEELEKLVVDIIQQGITPVLMTNARNYRNIPDDQILKYVGDALYYYYCFDEEGLIAVGDCFNEQIRSIANRYKLLLIDLAKVMPGGDRYFASGSHFNSKGRRFVAQQIFNSLTRELLQHP